jgi:NADP-dependent 3-hydroxy acid dehydrogenase YdfG
MSDLTGKVIAITGASSGIGEATARLLASRGAAVMLGARRTDRLATLAGEIERAGGRARFQALDVTQLDQMQDFVAATVNAFGKLDVVVNNAGLMPLSPLAALKVDEWNRMIDVNIRGVLNGIAAGLPVMQRQGYGQFVNLSSIGGHAVFPSCAVYSATKFAVIAISEGLRQEHKDIRVTVISPGTTRSELAGTISDPQARAEMEAFRSIVIEPDAIGRAIAFAVSEPAEVDVSEIIVRPTASPY